MSDEIISAVIGAVSGGVTSFLVAHYQLRSGKREKLLEKFDDSLSQAMLEATIYWSKEIDEFEAERSSKIKASLLKLSAAVSDILDLMLRPRAVRFWAWAVRESGLRGRRIMAARAPLTAPTAPCWSRHGA